MCSPALAKRAAPSSPSLNRKIFFVAGLVIFACSVRSGAIVDRSFLPRFLLLAVVLLITWITAFRNKPATRTTLFDFSLTAFFLWSLLSSAWAILPSEALVQSQLLFLGIMVFVIVSSFLREDPGFESLFIKSVIILLFFSYLLAFLKILSLEFYDPYKIISVSANNNLYAGFLLLSFPLLLSGYKLLKVPWKYLSVAAGILSLFFLVIVQSRAAYLGLAVSTLILIFFISLKYRHVYTRRNFAVGITALVILAATILSFYASLDQVRRNYFLSKLPVWSYFISYDSSYAMKLEKKRAAILAGNQETAAFDFSEDYYENANLRVIFWKKSMGLVEKHSLAGVGAGNWRVAVPSVAEPANPEHTRKNFTYSQPHNEWISILAELGLIGLLLALPVFFLPPGLLLRQILKKPNTPPVTTLFYAAFILGFYLFAAFDFPLKRVEHNILLFSLMAFILREVPLKPLTMPGFMRPVAKVIPSAVTFLLLLTIATAAVRLRSEYYTLGMFRNERQDDEKVIWFSRMAGNPLYRITPNTLPLEWFEGVAHFRQGDAAAAVPCFTKALACTPYEVRVLNDYGIALFSLKKTSEARAVLMKAWQTDPWFDDAKFNLAAIAYLGGQPDSARYWVGQCRESQKKKDFLEELSHE
jgi:O-antigen ligase